ncbi:cell wall-binding repeat-containing protein [Herbiconiux sp. 11R-BC]|uniref:cell wall-binding repeat-containing protein n=1 Tax=Herbiconiux sp. 11R-BC TaxID=3111637 RepID=UPI003C02D163
MSSSTLARVGLAVVAALLCSSPATGAAGATVAAAAAATAPLATQLVSVSNTPPFVEGSRASRAPSVSADGRYVAFESAAGNLTAIATDGWQVYVRDTQTGSTQLVSATPGGVAGDGDSMHPSISADGNRIVYVSSAHNLSSSAIPQAMLWDRATGLTRTVSLSNDDPPVRANSTVNSPVISGDGSTVAFSTAATNLTGDDNHSSAQVYARDIALNATRLVSVDETAAAGNGSSSDATSPSISGGGQAIAFVSKAWLSPTAPGVPGAAQVWVSKGQDLGIALASVNSSSTASADAGAAEPAISNDGGSVAFVSAATNLVGDPTGGHRQVFLRSLTSAASTRLVSYNDAGTAGADHDCDSPVISLHGEDIAFVSAATDLVPGGGNGHRQSYVRRVGSGRLVVASRTDSGAPGNGDSTAPAMSRDGSAIALTSIATDLVPGATGASEQVYLHELAEAPRVDRIDGADRFAVAAAVSKATFAPHVETAYIASGKVFPDALSGSAAAGLYAAPVLLVTDTAVPAATATELTRLKPGRIVVLGGTVTISADVEAALRAYAPAVQRVSAPDRFQLSAAISASLFTFPRAGSTAFIASGAVFPDALAGSAAAGLGGAPVLLVTKDAVPDAITAELKRLKSRHLYVLGGTATVSESVVTDLKKLVPDVTRIAGADRFEVSANISAQLNPDVRSTVYVASGATFPDALAGSAAAVQTASSMLLVNTDSLPPAVAAELDRIRPTRIVLLGGRNSVSDGVQRELEKHVYPAR